MAFLEKPRSSPHWHLVLQLTEEQNAREDIVAERSFSPAATLAWKIPMPSGTIDIQRVEDDEVNAYVTKATASGISFENFVHSRQMLKLRSTAWTPR